MAQMRQYSKYFPENLLSSRYLPEIACLLSAAGWELGIGSIYHQQARQTYLLHDRNQTAMQSQNAPLLSISDDGMAILPWRPVHVLTHNMFSNLQINGTTGEHCLLVKRCQSGPNDCLACYHKTTRCQHRSAACQSTDGQMWQHGMSQVKRVVM